MYSPNKILYLNFGYVNLSPSIKLYEKCKPNKTSMDFILKLFLYGKKKF